MMDEELRALYVAPLVERGASSGSPDASPCEDVRVFVFGEELLVSCMTYWDDRPQWRPYWHLYRLDAEVVHWQREFRALLRDFAHPASGIGAGASKIKEARNLGLMLRDGRFSLLWWMTSPADVRPWGQMVQERGRRFEKKLHNNGNPLELPEEGAYLGVGHYHGEKTITKYGANYVHQFVLFQREAPFRELARSPEFCFPAFTDQTRCEVIQFIGSILRDGPNVRITWGVNDCESATAWVPLADLLRFVRGGA